MSLAEPRKKQRLSADPQNTTWANDKSAFGFKMLQKMGWKEGSGLGVSGDGMIEHIKVTLKGDSTGLGADKTANAADESGHLKSYEQLLKQLNESAQSDSIDGQGRKDKKEKGSKTKDSKKSKHDMDQSSSRQASYRKRNDKEKKKDAKASPSTSVSRPRLAHRHKIRANKSVSGYTAEQLKEIFGV